MELIYLRKLTDLDVTEEYLSWFATAEVNNYLDIKFLSKESATKYIAEGFASGSHFMYGIFLSDSEKHIGNCKIGPVNQISKVADLVTVIGDSNYHKKGLGSLAIKLGSELAFERYNIRKLSGRINSKNLGSVKAYLSAGWIIEGVLKDHDIRDGIVSDLYCVSKFNQNFKVAFES
jgi:ribosomal-protein-alanine N-acetyltransferase